VTTAEVGRTDRALSGFAILGLILAAMWVIEAVDRLVLDDRLQGGGIHPRAADGIDGILWAPMLHLGISHIGANSIPFLVLGLMVMARGIRTWAIVTAVVVIAGGVTTWLLARSGNHIGASGVVFGYMGYLVAAAVFERSLKSIALGVVAIGLYGGLVFGLIPRSGISWEGHLFGALAGAGAAWLLHGRDAT
jgi:membrane associated rhomboid family serine protease